MKLLSHLRLFSLSILLVFAVSCTEDTVVQPEQCTLKPNAGECFAAMPRYYYDQQEKKCKEFIWGGCNGVVPFNTMQECLDCGCK